MENIIIRLATADDIAVVAAMYLTVTDALGAGGNNKVGWQTGVYPTKTEAEAGFAQGALYVALLGGELAASVILNTDLPAAYAGAPWRAAALLSETLCVHTLCTHPGFAGKGAAKALLRFAEELAAKRGLLAVRCDTWEKNLAAQRLYESNGYRHCGEIDLGYSSRGLNEFFCYEKAVPPRKQ